MRNHNRFLALVANVNAMISEGYNNNIIADRLATSVEFVKRQRKFLLSLRRDN